jgi:hypothetical protein
MYDLDATINKIFSLAARDKKASYGLLDLTTRLGNLAMTIEAQDNDEPHRGLAGESAEVVMSAIAVMGRVLQGHPDAMQVMCGLLRTRIQRWDDGLPPPGPSVSTNGILQAIAMRRNNYVESLDLPEPPAPPAITIKVAPKVPDPALLGTGRVYITIRKHPLGTPQPTGNRRVYRMDQNGESLRIGIGKEGNQGWTVNINNLQPTFLTFRLEHERGQPVGMLQALEYFKRHNQ